jgi:hypothetical protein
MVMAQVGSHSDRKRTARPGSYYSDYGDPAWKFPGRNSAASHLTREGTRWRSTKTS